MTTTSPSGVDARRRPEPIATRMLVGAAMVGGCVLLAARPVLVARSATPSLLLAALFGALLVIGAWAPLPSSQPRTGRALGPSFVVLLGVGAFALGRLLVGGHPPMVASTFVILTNTLAAVAEEAWFRRLCFGLLAPGGTALAVVGSSVLFAAVHVSIYGYWVLPLDLAAGLLLGWQRLATGSWAAPAITHAVANLLVVL